MLNDTFDLSRNDLRAVLSLRELRRPTSSRFSGEVLLRSDANGSSVIARDRYRAVRIRLQTPQDTAKTIKVSLDELHRLDTDGDTTTPRGGAPHGGHYSARGVVTTAMEEDIFDTPESGVGGDDYVINMNLVRITDTLIAPTDPVPGRDSRYWKMAMTTAARDAHLRMARDGIDLIVQASRATR